MGVNVVLPAPAEIKKGWRQDFEAALSELKYGTILLRVKAGEVIRVEVTEAKEYGQTRPESPA